MQDKDFSTTQTFKRLWPMISPFKSGLLVAAFALIFNALADSGLIYMLKPLLDDGFGKADHSFLKMMAFVVVGMIILRGVTNFVSTYCLAWVSGKVVMIMRRRLFKHLMFMPVSFFDRNSTGKLLSRITYDSEMIIAVLIRMVSKIFRKLSKNMQDSMGELTSATEQMLKGHKVVLSFGGQLVEEERFDKVSNDMRRKGMKMVTADAISDPVVQVIASLALAAVLYLATTPLIADDNLTAGSFSVVVHVSDDASVKIFDECELTVPTWHGSVSDIICHLRFGNRER